MANSNGVITAPVRQVSDVKAVLQVSTNNLSELCKSSAVNKRSKCKPQSVNVDNTGEPIFFVDQAAREAAFKKGCWGLTNIPFFNDASRMVRWMLLDTTVSPMNTIASPVDSWAWRKPTKYRLGDFGKYYQSAVDMVQVGTPSGGLAVPYAGTCYFKYPMASDGYSISVADMCQAGVMLPYNTAMNSNIVDPTQLRLGLCIVYGDKSSYKAAIMVSDKYAYEESTPMTFPVPAASFKKVFNQAGDYQAFVFLGVLFGNSQDTPSASNGGIMTMAAVPGTGEASLNTLYSVNGMTGIFYPIPTSLSAGKITINFDPTSAITASIGARIDPQATRYVKVTYNVRNKETTSFVYVVVKVELYSGETLWQTAYPEGTSRIYLAAQGTLNKTDYNIAPNNAMASIISSVRIVVDVYESTSAGTPLGTVTTTATVRTGELPLPDVN